MHKTEMVLAWMKEELFRAAYTKCSLQIKLSELLYITMWDRGKYI